SVATESIRAAIVLWGFLTNTDNESRAVDSRNSRRVDSHCHRALPRAQPLWNARFGKFRTNEELATIQAFVRAAPDAVGAVAALAEIRCGSVAHRLAGQGKRDRTRGVSGLCTQVVDAARRIVFPLMSLPGVGFLHLPHRSRCGPRPADAVAPWCRYPSRHPREERVLVVSDLIPIRSNAEILWRLQRRT